MTAKNCKHIIFGSFFSAIILVIQMILAFIKVRIILTNYGHEYYSIYQSSNGIFSYLILLESGFSIAYLLKMYKPYAMGNCSKVQSLYLGLERMLLKIGLVMLLGVVVIAIIYPLILADNDLDAIEIRILIALCGLKFVLPYLFTVAKKQILNVVEKSYLISIIDSAVNCVTDAIIIYIAYFTEWSFLSIIFASVLMLIPSIIIYTCILNHYKKVLNFSLRCAPSYEASVMTKDIMAQKIAYLADNNVDQIILSTRDLLQTTIYTSYSSVVSYPVSLINQMISSFRGHMGVNLASDLNSSFAYFRKLLSLNLYIATVVSCVFILQAQTFVQLWIGNDYATDNLTIVFFAIILFRKCAEATNAIAREAKNFFKESKRFSLLAAAANFLLSIILVQFFDINGLLIATIVADVVILDYNNQKIVFNNIFNRQIDIIKELIPSGIAIILSVIIKNSDWFSLLNQSTWSNFIMYSLIITFAISMFVIVLYLIFTNYMRQNIISILKEKMVK